MIELSSFAGWHSLSRDQVYSKIHVKIPCFRFERHANFQGFSILAPSDRLAVVLTFRGVVCKSQSINIDILHGNYLIIQTPRGEYASNTSPYDDITVRISFQYYQPCVMEIDWSLTRRPVSRLCLKLIENKISICPWVISFGSKLWPHTKTCWRFLARWGALPHN